MYDKSYYRAELLKLKPIIKFSYFCKQLDISSTNLSKFLKDEHHLDSVSLDLLDKLYSSILNTMADFK